MLSMRGGGQPRASCGNPKQIGLDVRSLNGKWMLTQGCLSTSKLGGRRMFRVWRGNRVQPKVLLNKQQSHRTRRESEKCRFLDGL